MPATTPTYGIPYPESTDAPNGAAQMQALALEVEAEITRVDGLISAGPLIKACRVYRTTTQSIANGVAAAPFPAFNAERYDTDAMHDLVTNPGRITIKTAGLYSFGASFEFGAALGGTRGIGIRLNGTTYLSYVYQTAIGTDEMETHGQFVFAVNDYLELMVQQNSGAAMNIIANNAYSPEFWATRLGRVV